MGDTAVIIYDHLTKCLMTRNRIHRRKKSKNTDHEEMLAINLRAVV